MQTLQEMMRKDLIHQTMNLPITNHRKNNEVIRLMMEELGQKIMKETAALTP